MKRFVNGNYKYYESRGDKEKELSVKQYLNMIMPYLYDLINDHRIARRVWKIQINMRINFISSKHTGETRIIYMWSNNVSIMRGRDTNDIIKELFESFLHDYQEKLETIKGSNFVFESVYLMDYKLHRVRLKIQIFHHRKGTGKIFNKIMNQLLLISYLHRQIVMK